MVRGARTVVDVYVDPICPYTWVAACWLREVGRRARSTYVTTS